MSLGSADKKSLKSSWPFSLAISFIFSSNLFNHFGIKWIFCKNNHSPLLLQFLSSSSAPFSAFCPIAIYLNPCSFVNFFFIFFGNISPPNISKSLIGLLPGDKIKNIGTSGFESIYDCNKESLNVLADKNSSPWGKQTLINSFNAIPTLSGLQALRTNILWNECFLYFFHSGGKSKSSGFISLYHSLNLELYSFSILSANPLRPSKSLIKHKDSQAWLSKKSKDFSFGIPVFWVHFNKKSICFWVIPVKDSWVRAPFFCNNLIAIIVNNNCLCLSNIPADIHTYTVIRIFSLKDNTLCIRLSFFGVFAIAFSKK